MLFTILISLHFPPPPITQNIVVEALLNAFFLFSLSFSVASHYRTKKVIFVHKLSSNANFNFFFGEITGTKRILFVYSYTNLNFFFEKIVRTDHYPSILNLGDFFHNYKVVESCPN